jgi:hypothetical protein
MALVPILLNVALEEAFDKAMFVFAETIANNPERTNVADIARRAAAKTFAAVATPAIDLYIRSATITIPPGQTVNSLTTTPVPIPSVGSTITPSLPALII